MTGNSRSLRASSNNSCFVNFCRSGRGARGCRGRSHRFGCASGKGRVSGGRSHRFGCASGKDRGASAGPLSGGNDVR